MENPLLLQTGQSLQTEPPFGVVQKWCLARADGSPGDEEHSQEDGKMTQGKNARTGCNRTSENTMFARAAIALVAIGMIFGALATI